ncbi:nuclear transport factor 2 family protein [Chitinophaga nivalis]|uniref:Nuclear transport factor 2 family protein n=1 Tax=Chitinophaga nivalis TaxID=2991709 RepID=A0ABT3IMY2_9BACT|nr:nuclear transport factor 2 family protein [Chitinophaga nivalis]MCW3465229.1 nuclear transport factor 2 family protein [Chitinophaga nivalis]MCW3485079.1 nuclear transport factor 2 family protein [Chitinophaga nivalis]
METNTSIQQVLEKFLQKLLVERNVPGLLELYAEKVDWDIPGNTEVAPWVGSRSTKAEIATFYEQLYAGLEPISFDVRDRFFLDNKAIITGRVVCRIKKTDKIFDSEFTLHVTIENGLIIQYRMLEDSYALVVAATV